MQKEADSRKENGFVFNPASMVRTLSKRLSIKSRDEVVEPERKVERRATFELDDVERQERIMNSAPKGLYESFRRGLLEYVSEMRPQRQS